MEYELIFGTITANESAEFIKGMDILNRKIGIAYEDDPQDQQGCDEWAVSKRYGVQTCTS